MLFGPFKTIDSSFRTHVLSFISSARCCVYAFARSCRPEASQALPLWTAFSTGTGIFAAAEIIETTKATPKASPPLCCWRQAPTRIQAYHVHFRPDGNVLVVMFSSCFTFLPVTCSGSEAVEAAIKIARHATGRQNIIVFRGAHHGRTMGTMGLTTSKISFRSGFGPFPPGAVVTSYPYCARCLARPASALSGGAGSAGAQKCCGGPLADLEQLLHQARALSGAGC